MKISIRQLAEEVGVSHTTLRNAIAQLESQLGRPIGESQGKGKPTLLDLESQRLLRAKFWNGHKSIPSKEKVKSANVEIVQYQPSLSEKLSAQNSIPALSLKVKTTAEIVRSVIESVSMDMDTSNRNAQTLDEAELRQAMERGALNGARLFQVEEQAKMMAIQQLQLKKIEKQELSD